MAIASVSSFFAAWFDHRFLGRKTASYSTSNGILARS
jgi:hypothetical protein